MFAFFRPFVLLTACFLFGGTVALAAPPNITDVHSVVSISAARTYDVLEFAVALDKTVANPFDDDTTVDAVFTRVHPQKSQDRKSVTGGAGAETLTVPAFWYEPFVRETQADKSVRMVKQIGANAEKPGWRIRFCPPAPAGKWTLKVRAKKNTART